jgi:hypothetical protein
MMHGRKNIKLANILFNIIILLLLHINLSFHKFNGLKITEWSRNVLPQ